MSSELSERSKDEIFVHNGANCTVNKNEPLKVTNAPDNLMNGNHTSSIEEEPSYSGEK